jgi:hypothetical protein
LEEIGQLAMHRGGNILAACGSDGCRLFDIRNISDEKYKCLYNCKPAGEMSRGTAVKFHPFYPSVLVVGDQSGDVNFYDLNFTNQSSGFEKLFQNDF